MIALHHFAPYLEEVSPSDADTGGEVIVEMVVPTAHRAALVTAMNAAIPSSGDNLELVANAGNIVIGPVTHTVEWATLTVAETLLIMSIIPASIYYAIISAGSVIVTNIVGLSIGIMYTLADVLTLLILVEVIL